MFDPHLIFQNAEKYIDYMISNNPNPEGQYFDRKEVRKESKNKLDEARAEIKKIISAFTNSRGGILILGIDNYGKLIGLQHLNENEYNSLSQVLLTLSNHSSQTKEILVENNKLLLIYSPQGRTGVCSSIEDHPKSWIRNGSNNLPLSNDQKERLIVERNKSFEQLSAIGYNSSLLNLDVFQVFRKRFLEEQGSTLDYSDDEFLKTIGAIKPEDSKLVLTNAGLLFFGNSPTAQIPQAIIRILKYECEYKDFEKRGNPIFDRSYDGCLPVLLQKIRTFIKEAAFFKTYTYRSPKNTGIIDEPEFPEQAIEESIVNAIIHRDYSMPTPIECTLYKDAFVVRSPGKLLQSEFIPTHFSLKEQSLQHYPRNPSIVYWAKTMRDDNGQRFVKALSEGYRTMRDQMLSADLPAPEFITNGYTTVILYNNYLEREARIKKLQLPLSEQVTNLFEIELKQEKESDSEHGNKSLQNILLNIIKDKLRNLDWFIDRDGHSRITAHQKGNYIKLDSTVDKWIRAFPAYSFQVHRFRSIFYLSIDFTIQTKNVTTLDKLLAQGFANLQSHNAYIKFGGSWTNGKIEEVNELYAIVSLHEFESTEQVKNSDIIPNLNKLELNQLAKKVKIDFPFESKIKELSLSSLLNASRERFSKIIGIANFVSKEIFPISYNGFTAFIKKDPSPIEQQNGNSNSSFILVSNLKEPEVKFGNDIKDTNILSGLTKFGAYNDYPKEIEIIPFCINGYEDKIQQLILALKKGSMNFKGIEKTFKISIKNFPPISRPSAHDFLDDCKRLVQDYGNELRELNRIFLIHIPESMYPSTDLESPYYILKEFLLEKGFPVQMVDTPTLLNPKFKDLNLALNLVAKLGVTPWVLPAALPEADLFIGLSYAQYIQDKHLHRTMGYANIFDRYGQWQFYKGNVASFDYENKHIHLANLIAETLKERESLPDNANIHIHYSSKFNRLDREHILKAVHSVRSNAIVNFVWINTNHNIRMFDNRIEGNGSLSRGSYVITGKNQFYLSTTGYNPLKKSLGSPLMLEVNIQTEPFNQDHKILHKSYAEHLLSLTKLNWASTQSVNGEPVTIKYAHDIADLSQVFYRRKGEFKLHPILEKTPWFL